MQKMMKIILLLLQHISPTPIYGKIILRIKKEEIDEMCDL